MRILIAAGGSGGHIFPALALAEEISKRNDIEILFVASRRQLDRSILKKVKCRKFYLSINPMPYRVGLKIVPFAVKLIYDLAASFIILLITRPRVVVGFGGYTAGSVVLLAKLMGAGTLIHEQNLVPGRANKYIDRIVDKVAISFRESKDYFRNKNVVFTGNPLRKSLTLEAGKNIHDIFGFKQGLFTLLVMGGSQGARSLNRLAIAAIQKIDPEIRNHMQVIHLTGRADYDYINNFYKEGRVRSKVFSFIDNVHYAYITSDIAISRSGASAIYELALYGKPMILVPYPYSKNNQRFNAEYFAQKGAAVYKEESELDAKGLALIIEGLIKDKAALNNLSMKAKGLSFPESSRALSEEVMKCVK